MKDLVIVGNGGLAKEVAFLVEEVNRAAPVWRLRGFVASQSELVGKQHLDYPILGTDEWLEQQQEDLAVVVAIGKPAVLRTIHERMRRNRHLLFPNLIHPQVVGDWRRIQLGEGNIILNAASMTTAIRMQSLNVINPGCTVAHDCMLGSYNLISPGANLSGNVTLGDRVLVGTGAQVLQGLRIGDDVVIGAGAVVTKDLPEPGVYMGAPARRRE
ncbi:MAG: acetyltransferase [Verrucomicrobiia bacterium]|jgi:sugar O-acyltransferase (sialic acid O-acetyltransferase NeuD family)